MARYKYPIGCYPGECGCCVPGVWRADMTAIYTLQGSPVCPQFPAGNPVTSNPPIAVLTPSPLCAAGNMSGAVTTSVNGGYFGSPPIYYSPTCEYGLSCALTLRDGTPSDLNASYSSQDPAAQQPLVYESNWRGSASIPVDQMPLSIGVTVEMYEYWQAASGWVAVPPGTYTATVVITREAS